MSFEGKTPLVFERNGTIWTNSRDVAACFGKRHDNVARAIEGLSCSARFRSLNFEEVREINHLGQTLTSINMTKDGFTFLVMGFTGETAAAFKECYIDAFNRMETMLKSGGFDPATLESLVTKTVSAAMTAAMMGMKDMVTEVVEQTVEAKMAADPRAAVQEYIAPLTIAKKFGVPVRGRRRFTQGMGNRLAHICAKWEVPVKLCPVTGRRMFPSHVVDYWLEKEGRRVIAEHIARVSGQGVLPFRKSGRTSNP